MKLNKYIIGTLCTFIIAFNSPVGAFKIMYKASGTWTWGTLTYNTVTAQLPDWSSTSWPMVYWSAPQVFSKEMKYYINQAGTPDISGSNEFSFIESSLESWESVTSSSVILTYQGTDSGTQNKTDGKNIIFWESTNFIIDAPIAGLAMITFNATTGEISDVDIVLNDPDYTFVTSGLNSPPTLRLDGIVRHEVGHLMGIHHSDITNANMSSGVGSIAIASDDKNAVSFLYPKAKTLSNTSLGTVTLELENGGGADYRIYYGTSSGSYPNYIDIGSATTLYNFTAPGQLQLGVRYYMVVTQTNTVRTGGKSNELSVIPDPCRSDFDDDNFIGFQDFFILSDHMYQAYNHPSYHQRYDLNGNQSVDDSSPYISDTQLFANDLNHNCYYPLKAVAAFSAALPHQYDGKNKNAKIRSHIASDNGETVTLRLHLDNTTDLKGYGAKLLYNTNNLSFVGVEHQPIGQEHVLSEGENRPVFLSKQADNEEGVILIGAALPSSSTPVAKGGFIAEVNFRKESSSIFESDLLIDEVVLIDSEKKQNKATVNNQVVASREESESRIELLQNTPNPFNPSTAISFKMVESGLVDFKIYSITGQVIRHLIKDTSLDAGTHVVEWNGKDRNGKNVAAGVYFYQLKVGKDIATKKLTLLR